MTQFYLVGHHGDGKVPLSSSRESWGFGLSPRFLSLGLGVLTYRTGGTSTFSSFPSHARSMDVLPSS